MKIRLAAAAALLVFCHLASAAAETLGLSPQLDEPTTQTIPEPSPFNPRPAIAPPRPRDLNAAAAESLHPELDDAAPVLKNLTPKSDAPATQILKSLSPQLDNPK
jgi:hypothetical protein